MFHDFITGFVVILNLFVVVLTCLHLLGVQYLYNISFQFSDGMYRARVH
jgi:hypothetical protein